MIEVEVDDLCRVLGRLTLKGSQDDWGIHSQELFHMFEFLHLHGGVVALTEMSVAAVVKALSIVVPMEYKDGLTTLEKRLAVTDLTLLMEVA